MKRFAALFPMLPALLIVIASIAGAKTVAKVAHVGMLCAPCTGPNINAFMDELHKLGWVEGTNIVIHRKEASRSHADEFALLAADLVQSKLDVIVATNPQSARAAKNATSEIPIVIYLVADPVGMGLASSLAHPGGNLTGAATFAPGDFNGKAFEILRELLPKAKRLAAFINPLNEIHQLFFMRDAPSAAAKLGFQLDTFELHSPDDVPDAVARAKANGAEVLYVVPDAIISYPPNRVADLAARAGLPSMSLARSFAQSGGLLSYGPDFADVARLGAHYLDRVLKGDKPADLPIEQPSKYQLVINVKTARSLGVEIPQSLLARADEVIE